MKMLWRKIKFWFWWKFKVTEQQKSNWQMMTYGTGIMKNGKFIDIKNIFNPPNPK
jgi:hypothetical protein